jgi:hypothetical protein
MKCGLGETSRYDLTNNKVRDESVDSSTATHIKASPKLHLMFARSLHSRET